MAADAQALQSVLKPPSGVTVCRERLLHSRFMLFNP